ncbi:methyl-accepting chemotaxis protein, partial [Wenzhouxiangella sp. XN24]|uniref:methyl-accepting chemotaxis protein n=1 Tax=Wenzhouxiangella sp. XN24 TaxID=2713569 RepID=UPI0013F14283
GGSKLVEQAGATMEEIVSAVKRVTDIMAEISAASDEQSQGIEQVSTAVTQMDEVTQQNAALVEESAAAASSLEDQAHGLAQAVSVFRIDDAKTSGIAPRSTPAKAPAAKAPAAKANGGMPKAPARKMPKPAAVADVGEEWAEF